MSHDTLRRLVSDAYNTKSAGMTVELPSVRADASQLRALIAHHDSLKAERDAAISALGAFSVESARLRAEVERLALERDRLYEREVELARRLETAEQFFADRPARRLECNTLDDWRMMAEHYEYQLNQCSSGYNACFAKTIEHCEGIHSALESSLPEQDLSERQLGYEQGIEDYFQAIRALKS